MEKFIENLKKEIAGCSEWPQVSDVLENEISRENIPKILEILKEFSITDSEINDMIQRNLETFLEQMKTVCFHMISTFYNNVIRETKTTEFFTIHIKWFYVIFVYFALKRMACQKIIVWPNFWENQNIQKIFIDRLIEYERRLPCDYYERGLRPNFRIILTYITSSPSCKLEGIGGVPEYV